MHLSEIISIILRSRRWSYLHPTDERLHPTDTGSERFSPEPELTQLTKLRAGMRTQVRLTGVPKHFPARLLGERSPPLPLLSSEPLSPSLSPCPLEQQAGDRRMAHNCEALPSSWARWTHFWRPSPTSAGAHPATAGSSEARAHGTVPVCAHPPTPSRDRARECLPLFEIVLRCPFP